MESIEHNIWRVGGTQYAAATRNVILPDFFSGWPSLCLCLSPWDRIVRRRDSFTLVIRTIAKFLSSVPGTWLLPPETLHSILIKKQNKKQMLREWCYYCPPFTGAKTAEVTCPE